MESTSPAPLSSAPLPAHHRGVAPHRCGECCTKLESIGVTLGGVRVLEEVSLHLHCGELTAVLGPNGAGKTTLLRTLLGEVPHTGEVHFMPVFGPGAGCACGCGHDDAPRETAPRIGYVPQRLDFDRASPLSVQDAFACSLSRWPALFGVARRRREQTREALDAVQAGRLLHRKLGELSGGELQRVLLALSLTPTPNLLLLDEPVSGIDLPGRELFYRTVSDLRRRYDLSILLVSHDLAGVAAVCDRIVFLNRRVICAGPPGEVLAHPEVRHTFGLDLSANRHGAAAAPGSA